MLNPLRRLSFRNQTICVIIGGILVHLTLGTLYTVGNLNPYLASYLRAKVPGQQYVTYSLMSWLFSTTVIGQTGFGALGGILEHNLGPKWATLIGSGIMSFGVFISYFSLKHSFWLLLFTYGVIVGIGTGTGYNPPLACIIKWLPNNRGLANGMILAGFGLGAFIFNQVQTAFVNPWNYVPDADGFFKQEDLLDRVPRLFFVLSGIYIIMQVIGCLLLMDPPEDLAHEETSPILAQAGVLSPSAIETEGYPDISVTSPVADQSIKQLDGDDISPRMTIKTVTFWCLWWTMMLNGQATNFISTYFKIFGQTFIHNDYLLAAVGSVSSIFNSLGRIIWGHLGDRYSYQGCMVFITALMTIWMLTIFSTRYLGGAAYFFWVSAVFLTVSGQFSLFPMAIADAFGGRYFGINYGLFFTASAVTALSNSVLTTALLDPLGFSGMFELISGASFLAFCITAVIHFTHYGHRVGLRQ